MGLPGIGMPTQAVMDVQRRQDELSPRDHVPQTMQQDYRIDAAG